MAAAAGRGSAPAAAVQDPNEDTEWNDTLRNFGIFPSKEKPKDEIGEMVLHLQKEAEDTLENFLVKPYERMNLEELKEAEDDFDDNDDRKAFEMYSIPMCLLVNEHLSLLARKFPEVKFLKAIVNSCVPNYHNRYLPTILVYKTGEIKGSFTGVAECGGIHLKVEELESKLAEVEAIETDLEETPQRHYE